MRRDVFQAIADPTRRAIITLIAIHAMTPNAIAEHFDSSRQAVSKHLRYYHFNPKSMKEVADFIEPFRQMWEKKFDKLDSLLKKMKTTKKK